MKCRPETRLGSLFYGFVPLNSVQAAERCNHSLRAVARAGGGLISLRVGSLLAALVIRRHTLQAAADQVGRLRPRRLGHGAGRGRGYSTARKAWAPVPEVSGMSPRSCADTANELNLFAKP